MSRQPYCPDCLHGPGIFVLMPRFDVSAVLSVPGVKGTVEIPQGQVLQLRVHEGKPVLVVSGYVEVMDYTRGTGHGELPVPTFFETSPEGEG